MGAIQYGRKLQACDRGAQGFCKCYLTTTDARNCRRDGRVRTARNTTVQVIRRLNTAET